MTTYAVVSVYDRVAETFGRPFCAQNKPSAIRSFTGEVNNPQSGILHERPGDFQLVYLGVFDDQRGAFTVEDAVTLASGDEVVRPADQTV